MRRHYVKHLLLAICVLFGCVLSAAAQDCKAPFLVTGAGVAVDSFLDNRNVGCHDWVLDYSASGFSGLSIQPESANDNNNVPGTFGLFSGASAQTNTTSGHATFSGYVPYVHVNVTTVTGTGLIKGMIYGWKVPASVTVGSITVGTVGQGTGAAAGAPWSVELTDGTNFYSLSALGATSDSACASDAGTCSVTALLKRQNQDITTATGPQPPALSNAITSSPGGLTTYVTVLSGTTASSATDIAVLPGSGTFTYVEVVGVTANCTLSAGGVQEVYLLKRSTADSGGTSVAGISVAMNSSNTATALPLGYTANPTLGTLTGAVDRDKINMMKTSDDFPSDIYIWPKRSAAVAQPVILKGTAEQLAVNLGGAVSAAVCDVTFTWLEHN